MNKNISNCLIEGASGAIEVRYQTPLKRDQKVQVVVLSHPHPLHGGTMNNKVITTMERAFQSLGYITVAYNFRGVGQSEGEYDHGQGEQDDLLAVVAWAKQTFATDHLTLAGFSFGSYVSLMVQKQLKIDALCTVAPPVGLYDFSDISVNHSEETGGEKISWALIQGGQDEVVSVPDIMNWAMFLKRSPDMYWRATAGHFFHGELIWLKKVILLIFKE